MRITATGTFPTPPKNDIIPTITNAAITGLKFGKILLNRIPKGMLLVSRL